MIVRESFEVAAKTADLVGIKQGIRNMAHISELGDGRFLHPRSVIKLDEIVRARVWRPSCLRTAARVGV